MDNPTDENHNPITPGPQNRGREQESSPFAGTTGISSPRTRSSRNFDDLDDNELCVLATMALNTIRQRGIPHVFPVTPSPPKQPDIFENAKVEQIICSGLKPPYDGAPEKLLPTLNLIHIRRKNEVWCQATYIEQDNELIDMVTHFSKIKESTVLERASLLWDAPDALIQCHTRGTPTYYARLLSTFLMNSITNDFALLLHSRIDQAYSSDGPLLLHTLCSHIHRNHLAFVESIKNKIRTSTLSSFKNDVQEFLRFLSDNLKLIVSTGVPDQHHNDLIPHIFQQLRATTIPVFQQSILQWERDYYNNNLSITATSLVRKADTECQVLKHTNQWVETIDPSITAMQAFLQSNKTNSAQVFQSIAANFSEIACRQQDINADFKTYQRHHYSNLNNNPDWIYEAPQDMNEVRHYHGRTWHYCSKCGRNGRWVCTHTDATHRSNEGYRPYNGDTRYSRYRSQSPEIDRYSHGRANSSRYSIDRNMKHHSPRGRWDNRSRSRSPIGSRSGSPAHQGRQVSFRPPHSKTASSTFILARFYQ
jgi:hypothetical protein